MTLENIIFGILSIIAIFAIFLLGIFAYAVWKIGGYTKALGFVAIAVLLFLFFFGHALGLPKCFGLC